MALTYKCDICGKDTDINPVSKPVFVKRKMKITTDGYKAVKDGEKFDAEIDVPKMSITKRQNIKTGVVEDVPIQETEDSTDRAFIVQLNVGQEMVSRDFCKGCLENSILPLLKPLWDKLAETRSK